MSVAVDRESTTRHSAGDLVARMRGSFDSGRTRPLEYRLEQLAGLARFVKECEREIEQAIHSDLGRPAIEVYASETAFITGELALARKKLASWMKPESVPTSLVGQPGKSKIYRDPLGVVLIIGPWNYPLQLVLVPLSGAIAAGNCAIVKPSEIAPATGELLSARLNRVLSIPSAPESSSGGVAETTELLYRAVRPHLLYRQRHGRTHRDGSRRQEPDACHARARRQEPVHRRPADRPRRRRPADRLGQVLQRRPDVRRARLRTRSSGRRGSACCRT